MFFADRARTPGTTCDLNPDVALALTMISFVTVTTALTRPLTLNLIPQKSKIDSIGQLTASHPTTCSSFLRHWHVHTLSQWRHGSVIQCQWRHDSIIQCQWWHGSIIQCQWRHGSIIQCQWLHGLLEVGSQGRLVYSIPEGQFISKL